jgi:hypothetical protein
VGKPANLSEKKGQSARWPFDPLQPGDHEPVVLPEELKRVQKQTGAGPRKPRAKKAAKR